MDAGKFRLPGKKQLYQKNTNTENFVVVDVRESPIERPKKTTVAKLAGKACKLERRKH